MGIVALPFVKKLPVTTTLIQSTECRTVTKIPEEGKCDVEHLKSKGTKKYILYI